MLQFQHASVNLFSVPPTLTLQTLPVMGKQDPPIIFRFFKYHHRPICPQDKSATSMEETLFGITQQEIPHQDLRQDEFECLNLNITCPAGLTPLSSLPVMLWIHG